jgi:adenylosuccinate synthase
MQGVALRVGSLRTSAVVKEALQAIRALKEAQADALGLLDDFRDRAVSLNAIEAAYRYSPIVCQHTEDALFAVEGAVIFEGAQGVLLGQEHGFFPHVTRTRTLPKAAKTLLAQVGVASSRIQTIGVTRTYHTRHGAGPFPTEDRTMGVRTHEHNAPDAFQGNFRLGPLDLSLLRYAMDVAQPDYLAVTHADVDINITAASPELTPGAEDDFAYNEALGESLRTATPEYFELFPALEVIKGLAPVRIISRGPTFRDKTFL